MQKLRLAIIVVKFGTIFVVYLSEQGALKGVKRLNTANFG